MADDKYVRVVVVAVDESEDAMKAVKRAASLTTVNSRTQLHLVTAVPVPPLDLGAVSGGPGGGVSLMYDASVMRSKHLQKYDDDMENGRALLESLAELASGELGVPADSLRRSVLEADAPGPSSVGSAILEYVDKCRADVLAVGARGMGAVHKAALALVGLGSVSDYLLHNAQCPVLVVPHARDA